MLDAFRQDVRCAARHLRRSPGLVAAAVLTLTLGIGANTAIFSVLNALVLRSLPVSDPASLVGIKAVNARGQMRPTLVPSVDRLDADRIGIDDLCAYNGGAIIAVEANGTPSQAVVDFVTDRCLATLSVQPILGRGFTRDEARPPGRRANVVLIGYRFWQRMFGGDPAAVGKTLRSEGSDVTIVGILPAGYSGLQIDVAVDVLAPFGTIIPLPPTRPPGAPYLVGRLRPGVTREQAQAELTTRWPALVEAVVPTTLTDAARRDLMDVTPRVESLAQGQSILRDRYSRPLTLVFVLTALLLVLACINLGGLLLARLWSRRSELSIRRALGASHWRLLQQLMVESVMLAGAGALAALPVAWGAVGPLGAMLPTGLVERSVALTPDLRVLVFTTIVGVATGVVMNLLPVLVAIRGSETTPTTDRTVARATSRIGRALVVAQVAISVVLVVGATLLATSLYRLLRVDLGFSTRGTLTVTVMPVPDGYSRFEPSSYYPLLVERLSSLPGVRAVGYARLFPALTDDVSARQAVGFVGQPATDATAVLDMTSPLFFDAVGIPLRAGRFTRWSDNAASAPVAVVTESLARALDPRGDVIGRHIRVGIDALHKDMEIVGVVGNASMGNLRSTAPPVVYRPALQEGRFAFYPKVQVATVGDSTAIAGEIRDAVRALGHEYAHEIVPLDRRLGNNVAGEKLSATLAVSIAGLAALLAFVGVNGLLAYTVSRRTREIGVRIAIGATPGDVLAMVLREGVALSIAGIVIGMPCALGASGALASLMFGIGASEPTLLAACALFFLLLGTAAGLVPARRAVRVQPVEALKAE
jgi:predicted permease